MIKRTFILVAAAACFVIPAFGAEVSIDSYAAPSKYQPTQVAPPKGAGYVLPDGSIRIVGLDDMEGIITKLDELFAQTHPGTKFTYVKSNSLAAMYSLIFGSSAFAPVGITYPSQLTYTDIVHGPPFGIVIAHGSLNPSAKISPLAVIVNKSNPIETLTLRQVTSMFTQSMRRPVLSYWRQAGLRGEFGNGEIHPWGLPWTDHYPSEDTGFGDFVFNTKMGTEPPVRDYNMATTYAEVATRVSSDPSAIGITALNKVTSDVKVVGISEGDLNVPMRGTTADIRSGHYALGRDLRIYCRLVSGAPLDPFAREYVRMVLSPGGQRIIAEEAHGYIPLNDLELEEQLAAFP